VWTVLGKKSMAEFALNFTIDVVPKMEQYFGIDYALPKIDLVAVPEYALPIIPASSLSNFYLFGS